MTANLAELDLSGSRVSTGRILLKPGRHQTVVREAKVEPCKGGMMLIVEHDAVDGSGSITDRIIYHHTNPEAERIGKERMKSLLAHGGAPNPDRPGGVRTFQGLKVTTVVAQDEGEYVNDKGETRKRTVRVVGYAPPVANDNTGMFRDPNEDPPF